MPHNSERHDFEDSQHRLAGAEPARVPEGVPRDENDDPVF